jgi:hypothetical protein
MIKKILDAWLHHPDPRSGFPDIVKEFPAKVLREFSYQTWG